LKFLRKHFLKTITIHRWMMKEINEVEWPWGDDAVLAANTLLRAKFGL